MKLYGFRNGRTLRALWALEETGVRYEYIQIDLLRGEQRSEWFVKLNPGGKVPVLVDGDLVISESAAVCEYVADSHPESRLMSEVGTVERAKCY